MKTNARIEEIGAAAWDALAGADNPFTSFAFLSALEDSGCVAAHTGWQPQHLSLESPDGGILGVVPAYLKGHSQGEYVFDHAWADAFQRAGGQYYPKLQISIPFTPATAPKLLTRSDAPDQAKALLIDGLERACQQLNLSSAHATFLNDDEMALFVENQWLERHDRQYHWFNKDYQDFDHFLAQLASRKRKAIRKERRTVAEHGLKIEWLSGNDIQEHHWDSFFAFYMDTGSRKWGRPYLNRNFFSLIGDSMGDRIVLMLAHDGTEYVAGTLNLVGKDTLFGRYWGCNQHIPNLHFELCYYQAIDYAIAHNLHKVEAGAQGEHKIARGYEPVTTRSAHFIPQPNFRDAVSDYLEEERRHVALDQKLLQGFTPFKKE
nr:GNAT family N-acetyltransferase [Maritalea mediterranea]